MPDPAISVPFLPYGRQCIDDGDVAAVAAVLRGDWLTTGPAVDDFEADFAAVTGASHAVACSSGTAALHLALLALGIGEGDYVVVPSVTFLATANAARYVGAEVVFADVDPETGLITPKDLAEAMDRAPGPVKAILPVHLAGQIADMDGLEAVARAARAEIVEDACHALGGSDLFGRRVGGCAVSRVATFSLHPVKTIASGEGGVVTTNDAGVAEHLRRLRNHGMTRETFLDAGQAMAADGAPNPWYYEMPEIGFNYRLSDIHAALARSQLAKLEKFVQRRATLVAAYDRLLAPLAPTVEPTACMPGMPGRHLYVALFDFDAIGLDRAAFMVALRERGVGTQVHYLPLHRQPYYRERYGVQFLPGAEVWYARALSLPLFPAMADADVERVVSAIIDVIR